MKRRCPAPGTVACSPASAPASPSASASVGLVRLLFVASLLLPGTQVIVYLVLWILMPNENHA